MTEPTPQVWVLSAEDVERLFDALHWAVAEANPILLTIDGGVKVDVGDSCGWSPAYGSTEPTA